MNATSGSSPGSSEPKRGKGGATPRKRAPRRPTATATSAAASGTGKHDFLVAPKARGRAEPVSRFPEIVNVAAELFHDQGYAETSIEDIANVLGILKGSVYHYIHTKEDLLFAIIEEIHARTDAKSVEVAEFDGDIVDKLELFIDVHMRDAGELTSKVAVFFTDYRSLPAERRRQVQERRDNYEALLRNLIEEGQASGQFIPGIDSRLAAIGILQMLNGTYQWYRPQGRQSMEEVTHEFKKLILRGLLVDQSRVAV